MSKKKILIISDQFFPSIGSAANLMTDLSEYLIKKNFEVFVLTSHSDRKPPDSKRILDKNVITKRIYIPFQKSSAYLLRGFFSLIAPIIYFFWAIFYFKKFDYVFIYSPPLSLGLTGVLLKYFFNSKLIINVQDLFPQSAIDLGILKNIFLIWLFRLIEKKIYKTSDVITTHSYGNLKFIKEFYPPSKSKLKVMHNWIDFKKSNFPFNLDFEVNSSKKNIIFAGILGPSQISGLKSFIESFDTLNSEEYDLILLIEGSEVPAFKNYINKKNLQNIRIFPFISSEDYESLLSKVDIGLIALSEDVKTPVVPGKLLGYMKASLTVIVIADKYNDSHKLLKESGCGFSSNHEKENVDQMLNDLDKSDLKLLGNKGYSYAYENFRMENIIDKLFENL